MTEKYFKVKELNGGQSNIAFSFRITCKRLNYQDHRFGSDITWGGSDTRNNYHYMQPKPVAYQEAIDYITAGKKAAPQRISPLRNRYAGNKVNMKK